MTIENFTPLPAVIGGVLIGLASVWLLVANGRIAGVSGILHGLFAGPAGSAPGARSGDRLWRAWFIVVIAYASAFGAGLVVGIGLWISGIATPRKVLDFLDVTGSWDPSLALVIAGAVGVTLALFGRILKRPSPFFADRFALSLKRQVDTPLIAGATLFGIGWGIGGYCPRPALTALSNLNPEAFVFGAAMVARRLAHRLPLR